MEKTQNIANDTIYDRLARHNIVIPQAAKAAANYAPFIVHDNQVTISGQLPIENDIILTGTLGKKLDIEAGKQAAKFCAINILGQLNAACKGDLEKVERCIRLGVFVNATPKFTDHPQVANGASDLIADLFGEHCRFAVGVSSLPFNAAVEIDAVFALKP